MDQPKALKMAIVNEFRLPSENTSDMMTQIKALSKDDLLDFARIFKKERGWEWPDYPV